VFYPVRAGEVEGGAGYEGEEAEGVEEVGHFYRVVVGGRLVMGRRSVEAGVVLRRRDHARMRRTSLVVM
jgi:hypothetical protein